MWCAVNIKSILSLTFHRWLKWDLSLLWWIWHIWWWGQHPLGRVVYFIFLPILSACIANPIPFGNRLYSLNICFYFSRLVVKLVAAGSIRNVCNTPPLRTIISVTLVKVNLGHFCDSQLLWCNRNTVTHWVNIPGATPGESVTIASNHTSLYGYQRTSFSSTCYLQTHTTDI